MDRDPLQTVFIVGAGFSTYAVMPLQSEFTKALLGGNAEYDGRSAKAVNFIKAFVNQSFDHSMTAQAQFWPELEDIFTCLDMSANTGHNLGPSYKPSMLRTVRRALIYRIITTLRENYISARRKPNRNWKQLVRFFHGLDVAKSAFIATNWDTVVEDMWRSTHQVRWFDYGCDAVRISLGSGGATASEHRDPKDALATIIKIHGSVNWLYCENCRSVFWCPTKNTYTVARQLLSVAEWSQIDRGKSHDIDPLRCSKCDAPSLGTRLATFSYVKALDFPMFQKAWFSAERILSAAENWVFIGYSLPAADFEFKYLLKRVALAKPTPPNYVVISGGSASQKTYDNYQHFFGRTIKRSATFYEKGLDSAAIQHVSDLAS